MGKVRRGLTDDVPGPTGLRIRLLGLLTNGMLVDMTQLSDMLTAMIHP